MASDLPVDLLEEIFLCLDDAADLARASAACASFRRVVSDGRFLRRFRSLHRRPVLGLLLDDRSHYETGLSFYPAKSPRRSALAAAGFAKAADFTFSFLPDRRRWRVCDVRDGRVLLTRCPRRPHYMFGDHVAYDPLHRRHVQIPTIPGDLLLSAKQDGNNKAMPFDDDPFLAPVADEDEGFRVLCTARSKTKVVAFVFSSASWQWRCAASISTGNPNYVCTTRPSMWFRQYVHGCVCWVHHAANVMLVFDTCEMKFSIADLPHESSGMIKMAVEAGDGRLGLLVSRRCMTMDLYSKAWQGIQEPEEWRHDSSIPIMPGIGSLTLAGAAEGYVLLHGIPRNQLRLWSQTHKKPEEHYFTLELKTLLVEKLCVLECDRRRSFLYASFPSPFSLPSV